MLQSRNGLFGGPRDIRENELIRLITLESSSDQRRTGSFYARRISSNTRASSSECFPLEQREEQFIDIENPSEVAPSPRAKLKLRPLQSCWTCSLDESSTLEAIIASARGWWSGSPMTVLMIVQPVLRFVAGHRTLQLSRVDLSAHSPRALGRTGSRVPRSLRVDKVARRAAVEVLSKTRRRAPSRSLRYLQRNRPQPL